MPIKKRTKTFDQLKEMVLDGINTYWSSYSDGNLDDEAMGLLPNGWVQRISYNVGYIQYDWENHPYDGWVFEDEDEADQEFKETAAHEIGHEILQAFGGTIYSWQHKGSSYYLPQDRKPLKGKETLVDKVTNIDFMDTDGETVPKGNKEIDLMKYYYGTKTKSRIVANEKDVLGLLWLAKINLK